MGKAAAKVGAAEAYFSTSRSLGTGTTSTITMQIWRLVTETLIESGRPMTGAEIAQATGITPEQVGDIFAQDYYQKYYGFRRFESLEEWRTWALAEGVLFNPELHGTVDEEETDEPEGSDETGEEA